MARNEVEIKKGDLRGSCLPGAVNAWRRHGWTVVDDGSSEPVEKPAPETRTYAAPTTEKE